MARPRPPYAAILRHDRQTLLMKNLMKHMSDWSVPIDLASQIKPQKVIQKIGIENTSGHVYAEVVYEVTKKYVACGNRMINGIAQQRTNFAKPSVNAEGWPTGCLLEGWDSDPTLRTCWGGFTGFQHFSRNWWQGTDQISPLQSPYFLKEDERGSEVNYIIKYGLVRSTFGEMGSEHYCLRWNNHQSNLLGVFSQLLRDESLVDVTLACSEGHSIRAHKVVLSACSSYFQTLFVDHPSRHPIVILKDVRFSELRTLIEFMYKGEVNVEYCQLSALLKTAESLKFSLWILTQEKERRT
ncbi:hypothetical protein NQ318_007781 [Aromia moschata]|uniref:BTB domain-containing protein n=1 Tax=Aromia moschata TaxID=1265417 RepID=A0AAV8YZQ5_9CUCU|nr:hypothetical protein NQ318_007781 [Aromia moschata]